MEEEPDLIEKWYKRFVLAVIVVCAATTILFLFQVFFGIMGEVLDIEIPEEYQPFSYSDTSVVWWESLPRRNYQVLASVVNGETEERDDGLLYAIIKCESNFDPDAINEEYGCAGGMGLCQFIQSTWLETIDRMGELLPKRCRTLEAVFNGECNLMACKWLLETDGTRHWGYPASDPRGYIDGLRWGSYDCWSK